MHYRGPHSRTDQPDLPGSQEVFFWVSAPEGHSQPGFLTGFSLVGEELRNKAAVELGLLMDMFFFRNIAVESLLIFTFKRKHPY